MQITNIVDTRQGIVEASPEYNHRILAEFLATGGTMQELMEVEDDTTGHPQPTGDTASTLALWREGCSAKSAAAMARRERSPIQ